jgi:hypothetical protein
VSKLNEAAFLRSLSLDDEEVEHPSGSCPEPSILWALMQKDRSGSEMAEDLRNHIAVCPACLDLTKRLYAFHRSAQGDRSLKAEESWAESRPRLNQWIDTFLEQQDAAQAQPAPKPVVIASSASRRPFFGLGWSIPLAAATAALALIIGVQIWRKSDTVKPSSQIALAPIRPETNSSSAGSGAASSADQQQLMKNQDNAGSSATEAPQIISFSGGERMKLRVTSVQAQEDGSYRLTGTLLPVDSQNALLDSANVAGVFLPASPQPHLELRFNTADFRNRSYRVPARGIDDEIQAVPLNQPGAPQVGQTIEIQIEHAPNLQASPQ